MTGISEGLLELGRKVNLQDMDYYRDLAKRYDHLANSMDDMARSFLESAPSQLRERGYTMATQMANEYRGIATGYLSDAVDTARGYRGIGDSLRQLGKYAGHASYALTVAQILETAWNAKDKDAATAAAEISKAIASGAVGIVGSAWGVAVGAFVVAAIAGVFGVASLPVAVGAALIGLAAGTAGYYASEFADALIDWSNENLELGGWVADEGLENILLGMGKNYIQFLTHPYDYLNDLYLRARGWRQIVDPLALDLDGDGIETIGIGTSPVLFDHDANGIRTGTGWIKADDGFLVLDRNGNGRIDSGRELFGVETLKSNGKKASDGLDALANLDQNQDGVFDAKDAQFAAVRVWRDLNQNGVSEANELFSLAQLGIAAINLSGHVASVAAIRLHIGGRDRLGIAVAKIQGDDRIYAQGGDDVIDASRGDDYMEGNGGRNTYILRKGSGQDRINNFDSDTKATDTLRFEDVAFTEITLSRSGNDLVRRRQRPDFWERGSGPPVWGRR